MIVTTVVAKCDYPLCPEKRMLNPNTTQPYRDLAELDWALADDGAAILCPGHNTHLNRSEIRA